MSAAPATLEVTEAEVLRDENNRLRAVLDAVAELARAAGLLVPHVPPHVVAAQLNVLHATATAALEQP